jgi:hypothetical protein
MNVVELHAALKGLAKWQKFAEKLQKAMTEEYRLDGATVILRELTGDETLAGEHDLLTFNQDSQRFEFAVSPDQDPPPAWKIADRIDYFLNPNEGGDG